MQCTQHPLHGIFAFTFARPIVKLVKCHNIRVEVKAAMALEALAANNYSSQQVFLDDRLDAPKALMKLLKVHSPPCLDLYSRQYLAKSFLHNLFGGSDISEVEHPLTFLVLKDTHF